MAYCTQDDILLQLQENILIQLTDDADAGVVDADVVTRAIADADEEIDSYCGGRYTVPLTPVPAIIRKFSVDMAIYHLYVRRMGPPDERKARYENALRFLRDLSRGVVTLGASSLTPATTGDTASVVSGDRIFTRDKLSGY